MKVTKRKHGMYTRVATVNRLKRSFERSECVWDALYRPRVAAIMREKCDIVRRLNDLVRLRRPALALMANVAGLPESVLADILRGHFSNQPTAKLRAVCGRITRHWPAYAPDYGPVSNEHCDWINAFSTSEESRNPHIGSDFDDFLHEEGILEEVKAGTLVKLKRLKLSKWGVLDCLRSEDDIAGYLVACQETADEALIQAATIDAQRARERLQGHGG